MTTYLESKNRGGRHSCDAPAPTVMAGGLGDDSISHWALVDDGKPAAQPATGRPPYRVPTMEEIRAAPRSGLMVASLFAGAGGSSLGYEMAGLSVIWANEFDAHAAECHRLNFPECIHDERDVRDVRPEDVMIACGLGVGELNVLDGSPPCQSFSTAGRRKMTDARCGLFFEFARILNGLQPKAFVAENVSGLVKGAAKGYFLEILARLKACGYRVRCKLLDAQWLGVPQARVRAIFIGAREDLGLDPVYPKPLRYRYSVRDALPWIGKVVHDTSGLFSTGEITDRPCPAVTVGGLVTNAYHFKVEAETDISGATAPRLPPSVARGGRLMQRDADPDRPAPTVTCASPGNDILLRVKPETDIGRYAIVHPSGFGKDKPDSVDRPMPTVMARPEGIGGMGPGQTLLQTPTERRKFTIAELKRICGFPDDFVLTGSYAQQWKVLGNSVPPVMAAHIAAVISRRIFDKRPAGVYNQLAGSELICPQD